jgi:phosphatidylserine/phosphatidylglycerophosphate/cardiolipin synthase-like enzyme
MLGFSFPRKALLSDSIASKLYDENTFYPALMKDMKKCQSELIIESPFTTNRRLQELLPIFQKLKNRRVRVVVNTRNPRELDDEYRREDSLSAIANMQMIGVQVLFTVGHHRKLVIIDRKILYEGSLNILSQNNSCEFMGRIESTQVDNTTKTIRTKTFKSNYYIVHIYT